MRIVVTGAAGFIGSHLTEDLRSRGEDVLAVDSFTDYYDPDRKRHNARNLDVAEIDLERADGDAEGYPTPEDATPHPISPYGVTKLSCEHLAYAHSRTIGLEAVGLRYFTVYGPRQRPDM